MLFSATQTTKVTDLARISLRPGPLHIDVEAGKATSTNITLSQGYVVCPSDRRFLLLFTFLKKNLKKKVVVFFSSCNSVKYHAELLNYIDVPVLDLHVRTFEAYSLEFISLPDRPSCIAQGKQKQQKRTTTFFEFCNATQGTLLCTDVAARGLDIPKVDWIVQFDPPDDPRDYIHRVGRTARAGKDGKSLLFLLESEIGFLRYLKDAKVPLNEFEFPANKIANVQSQVCESPFCFTSAREVEVLTSLSFAQLEKLLQKNYYLHQSARDGFRSYLQAYASYSLKKIFDINKLDLSKVGKAFGFAVPPRVSVTLGGKDVDGVNPKHGLDDSDDEKDGEEVLRPQKRRKNSKVGSERRVEQLGRKKVDKEVYRKDKLGKKGGPQWSR